MRRWVDRYVDRNPVVVVVVASALPWVIGFGVKLSPASRLSGLQRAFLFEAILAVVAVGAVAALGRWRQVGLTGPWKRRKNLIGIGLLVVLSWALATPRIVAQHRWGLLPELLPLVLTVGLAEETLMRGWVLGALVRRGPLVAGVGSAVVFGLLHFVGLLGVGNVDMPAFAPILARVAGASMIGLLFASARLRMGTLWPTVIAHALYDLPLLALPPPAPTTLGVGWIIAAGAIFYGPFAVGGLILLIRAELRWRAVPAEVLPAILPEAQDGSALP